MTKDQQAALMLHRARDLLVRQRTQLINAIRGHLAELGVIEAQGPWNVPRLLAGMTEAGLPDPVPGLVRLLAGQLEEVELRIGEIDTKISAWHKASPVCQRLAAVPGIGPLVATAIVATMPDPTVFRSGREFAAWLGPVPRQNSTGGKTRLGRTSRQGNAYLRRRSVPRAAGPSLGSSLIRPGICLDRLRQQTACPRAQDHGQRIIDLLGLPETDNGAILVHGVSLRLEVLAGWLPASIRHLPQTVVTQLPP